MNFRKIKLSLLISFFFLLIFILTCTNLGANIPDTIPEGNGIIPQPVNNYAGKIQNGEMAPDFTFTDVNGNTVTLSELRGKRVLLNLWWIKCHGCNEEMPYLQEFYDKYTGQGVILIAVNQYEKESVVKSYVEGKNYTFTVIADSKKQLPESYTNWGVPTTFFIDEQGYVRARKDAGFISVEEIEDIYNTL